MTPRPRAAFEYSPRCLCAAFRWLRGALPYALACALAVALLSACSGSPRAAVCTSGCAQVPTRATNAAPPPLKVLTRDTGPSKADIFIAPAGGVYRGGPEIVTTTGKVVWFHLLPAGDVATDFRAQTYLGQPVLTWFQSGSQGGNEGPGPVAEAGPNPSGPNPSGPSPSGPGPSGPSGPGPSGPSGTDYIYNDHYQRIGSVRAGNGDATNFHEFLITPWNTALITATRVATANLSSIGGSAHQLVIDGLVQEIDIKTGRVLFQWDSAGPVPYADSYMPLPPSASMPWDWFHINAVHLDTDGNLLVGSRNTWTVFKVNRHTGAIMWQLGGKHSSFKLQAAPGQVLDHAGKIFAWQHDPEAVGGDEYTVFDDESEGHLLGSSRAVTVRLDLISHVATLVKSDEQPEGQVAQVMGNAQTTPGGDLFVGWGSLPYISEFSPSGKLLFNAELPPGVETYRAYLLPWTSPG